MVFVHTHTFTDCTKGLNFFPSCFSFSLKHFDRLQLSEEVERELIRKRERERKGKKYRGRNTGGTPRHLKI